MPIRWNEFNPDVINNSTHNAVSVCNELLRITAVPGMSIWEFITILERESAEASQVWLKHMCQAVAYIYSQRIVERAQKVSPEFATAAHATTMADLNERIRVEWNLFVAALNDMPDSRPGSPDSRPGMPDSRPGMPMSVVEL